MILIKSKTDGFRRCGEVHTVSGRKFPQGHFTDDELAYMENDPELYVSYVPDLPAQSKEALENMTCDKLKSQCDAMGIDYPARAAKAVLIELILKNTDPAAGE